jgi:hypothetical protein
MAAMPPAPPLDVTLWATLLHCTLLLLLLLLLLVACRDERVLPDGVTPPAVPREHVQRSRWQLRVCPGAGVWGAQPARHA